MNVEKIQKRQYSIEYEISKLRKEFDISKFPKNIQEIIKLYDEYIINSNKLSEQIESRIITLERIIPDLKDMVDKR